MVSSVLKMESPFSVTAEFTVGQNPAVLNTEDLEEGPNVSRNILVTLDHAADK
jgi:hypothetical protein